MRFLIAGTTASLMIAGAVLASAAPARADDDAFFNHAKGTMTGASSVVSPSLSASTAPHQYMQEEQRDTQVQASTSDDPLFNHAKGTMTGEEPAAAPAGSNYVASYHQYMQIEPRDSKVDPNASEDVDGANPWFNHAKGTMSSD